MTASGPDLTELIGSRICHDLISPLGAISNGLELLSMSGDATGPEVDLITESVENANARLRFFRIAFGAADQGQLIGHSDVTSVLAALNRGSRIGVEWLPHDDQDRRIVKVAFLLVQCFETAMPWGGQVRINELGGEWSIHGTAERMQIDPELWHQLSQPRNPPDLEPAKVQFALAPIVAATMGRRLTVESAADSARIRF